MKNNQNKSKVQKLIQEEIKRQKEELQLIPSENYTSSSVRYALGSPLTHKYSEGQVGSRYYEGNEVIDKIENLCKKEALKLFGLTEKWHVNVQAYSGSIANLAVLNALLKPNDKIMAMYLFEGGHLSHGWKYKDKKITLSSKIYNVAFYHVDNKTEVFDYDAIKKLAQKEKPNIIISGGTAYPREIDHNKLSQIAKTTGAYYLADIAHEAGLVAGGVNKSPFPYADVVTMTTHKTLRGPRGALIFCKKDRAEEIDRSVFPGIQGGPFNNNIAAIAVCLMEAQTKVFKKYAHQIIKNTKQLEAEFKKYNYKLISGGTEKHLLLINLASKNINGKYAARALRIAGITLNKNTVPNEQGSPFDPSGIRLGTPAVSSRGMQETEMKKIAGLINDVIEISKKYSSLEFEEFQKKIHSNHMIHEIRNKVTKLCNQFPLPK